LPPSAAAAAAGGGDGGMVVVGGTAAATAAKHTYGCATSTAANASRAFLATWPLVAVGAAPFSNGLRPPPSAAASGALLSDVSTRKTMARLPLLSVGLAAAFCPSHWRRVLSGPTIREVVER